MVKKIVKFINVFFLSLISKIAAVKNDIISLETTMVLDYSMTSLLRIVKEVTR